MELLSSEKLHPRPLPSKTFLLLLFLSHREREAGPGRCRSPKFEPSLFLSFLSHQPSSQSPTFFLPSTLNMANYTEPSRLPVLMFVLPPPFSFHPSLELTTSPPSLTISRLPSFLRSRFDRFRYRVGTGEYTTGFVGSTGAASTSDKKVSL